MNHKEMLFKFRRVNGLEDHLGDIVTNVLEEIVEVRKASLTGNTLELVGELTDICVYCENGLAQVKAEKVELDFIVRNINLRDVLIDISMDIVRYDRDQSPHIFRHIIRKIQLLIQSMGFDYERCMIETVKKISSRKGKLNPETKKWEKCRTQDPFELYTPNYKKCMIGSF